MTDDGDRLDELEAMVERQRERNEALAQKLVELSQILPEPDRREFLRKGSAGAALLALGAVGGASAAPGDDGDTLWGSDQNRDDYYVDELDANLVSTVKIGINGISTGTSKTLYNADETDGDNQLQKNIKYTFNVSTSAETILSPTSSDFFVAAKVTVLVREGTSVYALDEVMMLSDGTATANSTIERNNPASRTYSVANGTDLQLELASSTANVVAVGELLDINQP